MPSSGFGTVSAGPMVKLAGYGGEGSWWACHNSQGADDAREVYFHIHYAFVLLVLLLLMAEV